MTTLNFHKASILTICVLLLTQGSCEAANPPSSEADTCSPRLTARCAELSPALHQSLHQAPDGGTVSLRSSGGSSLIALQMARSIIQRQLDAEVIDFCMSACLSILLPAFREIEAVDHPLILAHGGSLAAFSLIEQEIGQPVECFERYRALREAIFAQKETRSASMIQIERLDMRVINIRQTDGCADGDVVRAYDAWAPTSRELERDFGLEIDGPVAADDGNILQARLNAYLPPGTTVRSGDDIFVSAAP